MDGLLEVHMGNAVVANIVISNKPESDTRGCGLDKLSGSLNVGVTLAQGHSRVRDSLRCVDILGQQGKPKGFDIDTAAGDDAELVGSRVSEDLGARCEQAGESQRLDESHDDMMKRVWKGMSEKKTSMKVRTWICLVYVVESPLTPTRRALEGQRRESIVE